jgi:hypothetical protein
MLSAALPPSRVGSRPSDRFRLRRSNTYLNQRLSFPRNESKNSVKQWNSLFFRSTEFAERPFVKAQQKIRAVGDVLDIFLRGSGSLKQTWITDVVKGFFRANHTTEGTTQEKVGKAWLDDRDVAKRQNRVYPKWQTAQQLRSELEKPVCNTSGIAFGADRSIAIQSLWRT